MRAQPLTAPAPGGSHSQFAEGMRPLESLGGPSPAPGRGPEVTAGRSEGVAAPTHALRGSARQAASGRHELRVLYRVAAGPRIGFGHLLRMRALADAVGGTAWLTVRGGRRAITTAHELGFHVVPDGVSWSGIDVLVIDDPDATQQARWVRRGQDAGTAVVVVQDTPGVSADLVVQPSALAVAPPAGAGMLVGPRFALLDLRLAPRAARQARRAPRVLVALGGGAHVRRVAQPLVHALRARVPDVDILVAGGFAARLPPIAQAQWVRPGRAAFLAALADCDAAIVAGGVTILEACVTGTPSVGLAVVPAQRPAIRALSRAGAVVDAVALASTPAGRARAAREVARLLDDRAFSRRLSRQARVIVDGQGALRVARALRALVAAGGARD